MMRIENPLENRIATEMDVLLGAGTLKEARVLELGCGTAFMTRRIAEECSPAEIIATEVDRVQFEKNLLVSDLPTVKFVYGGAEQIDQADSSVDVVLMFKSLHHVPKEKMDQALSEIARVLKPGGIAYISEPVYAGEFNEILRLFNDEREARSRAFQAIEQSVKQGKLELIEQIFFLSPTQYKNFEEFEARILKVTHTDHRLDSNLFEKVRERFTEHMTAQGARFLNPMRVDLLRRPVAAE